MDTSDATAGLTFDRAAYTVKAEAGPPCASCNRPLGEQYWQWQGKPVCEGCRGKIAQVLAQSQSTQAFVRAALLGGATAIGCGIAYAVFVAVTDTQFALVTIGIAFLIAKVMRRCSAGIGGRKYQVLALALTYGASAMGYAPGLYKAFTNRAAENQVAAAANERAETAGAPSESAADAPRPAGLVLGFAAFLALTLAAPVLAARHAPIGLLIVGIGLWEAWKLSRGLPLSIEGPYRATPATGPPAG